MYRELAPFDPDGVLRHEWFNARAAIPRFDRDALEIRVIDVQECPRADLAIAAATVAAVRALFEERWAGLAAQQAIGTDALAAILLDCIRDGEQTAIDNAAYLQLLGLPRARCSANALWRHLIDAAPPEPCFAQELAVILDHGPLARRILRSAGAAPSPARLAAIYGTLCDCLAAGRMFTGLDR